MTAPLPPATPDTAALASVAAPPPARRRTWLALVLLVAVALLCASLGRWQLQRAEARRAVAAAIDAGRRLPPLMLSAATPAQDLQPWRAARARGQWQNALTVLLENRNLDGQPGFWVATPLKLADGSHLLVLRGWLARPAGASEAIVPPGAPGEQHITGELAHHVPRLFELPRWRATASGLALGWPEGASQPRVQNLPLEDLAQVTGLSFLPVVLMQTEGEKTDTPGQVSGTTLLRRWPQPATQAEKNIGYAIQWFAFASIAGIAALVLAWRSARRRAL